MRGLGARLDEAADAGLANAIADEVEDAADALATVAGALCPRCGIQHVKVRIEISTNPR